MNNHSLQSSLLCHLRNCYICSWFFQWALELSLLGIGCLAWSGKMPCFARLIFGSKQPIELNEQMWKPPHAKFSDLTLYRSDGNLPLSCELLALAYCWFFIFSWPLYCFAIPDLESKTTQQQMLILGRNDDRISLCLRLLHTPYSQQ